MSEHALDVLEFGRVLERVASRAASAPGRARVLALRPSPDAERAARELARVAATMRFIDEDPDWGMVRVPDVRAALLPLSAEGVALEPGPLFQIGVLLESSRRLARDLARREGRFPELGTVAGRLVERRELEEAIGRSVDAEGHVLDGASRELKRLRDRLRGAQARIVQRLEAYLGSLPDRYVVPDGSVTIREGRYVVPIRREGKGDVGGIVHDESQSGATLFVEPPVAIELMNALREVEREEAREVHRILLALTARISPDRDALLGALDALVDFDSLHARARCALTWRAHVPELADDPGGAVRIRDGRHPLLVESSDGEVVPFDLDLEADERALVVSGPNTGGKSVFLKATGLIAALAQSGVIPPVGPGTRVPVYARFFADIGDEQSIAHSLSTFSAHLANLSDIVAGADERSLVLIDEMGTGTDPAEGAALARAVLEELVARGATTIATSHLGDLKRLDAEGSGIVNAALQFDARLMEPTYRLVKGRPGRSYGLAIARRLGFPPEVLDRAEAHRADDEARMEDLLARLERRDREAERTTRELEDERARAAGLREDLEDRERRLRDAESTADRRAREEARRLLLDARSEVEDAIEELRAAAESGAELDEVAGRARSRVERAARRQRERARERREPAGGVELDIGEGARVRIRATGARGRVLDLRDDRALVEAGALKLELPLADLEPISASAEEEPRRRGGWSGPAERPVRTEIDLRGLRVEELDGALVPALDQAILEDLAELRIIHGKGTGALRQRVGEVLGGDARVRSFRMGGPTEGGAGVTVAVFRDGS